jgi:hypothetical protein
VGVLDEALGEAGREGAVDEVVVDADREAEVVTVLDARRTTGNGRGE